MREIYLGYLRKSLTGMGLCRLIRGMATDRKWPWHEKVQAERGRRGWSYARVASEVSEDSSQVRRWLTGEVTPRSGIVPKFAKALGWPVAYLEDPGKPYPPVMDDAWRESVLDGVDEPRRRIIDALADDDAVSYLVKALDQFEELRDRLRR